MRGYTLPVWLAAAAHAALGALRQEPFSAAPELELLEPPGRRAVPVRATTTRHVSAASGNCSSWRPER